MGNNFLPTLSNTSPPPRQAPNVRGHTACLPHLPYRSPIWVQIKYDLIHLSKNKDKQEKPCLTCSFRSGYRTQHGLLNLINKWQSCLDNSGVVGTILMDLVKAFECLPYELILVKLHAYGVDIRSL